MTEAELRKLFENKADCWTDYHDNTDHGCYDTEQAMTADRIVEIAKEQGWIDQPPPDNWQTHERALRFKIDELQAQIRENAPQTMLEIRTGHDGDSGTLVGLAVSLEAAERYVKERWPKAQHDPNYPNSKAFWIWEEDGSGNTGRWARAERQYRVYR